MTRRVLAGIPFFGHSSTHVYSCTSVSSALKAPLFLVSIFCKQALCRRQYIILSSSLSLLVLHDNAQANHRRDA